mmetsp:Transcript_59031/g.120950  ORF Transcript_59031/g.120950 Transcript_59031/m.120950 type:complete len:236 (+) Transcript_59031:146-853(+)
MELSTFSRGGNRRSSTSGQELRAASERITVIDAGKSGTFKQRSSSSGTLLRHSEQMQQQPRTPVARLGHRRAGAPPRRSTRCLNSPGFILIAVYVMYLQGAGATRCYLGAIGHRVATFGAQEMECPVELYGEDAVCAFACVRDVRSSQDGCSFMCLPRKQCRETYIHPESPASPELMLPGCPKHENYEPVQSGYLECVARCCEGDLCNVNSAPRQDVSGGFLLLVAIIVLRLCLT